VEKLVDVETGREQTQAKLYLHPAASKQGKYDRGSPNKWLPMWGQLKAGVDLGTRLTNQMREELFFPFSWRDKAAKFWSALRCHISPGALRTEKLRQLSLSPPQVDAGLSHASCASILFNSSFSTLIANFRLLSLVIVPPFQPATDDSSSACCEAPPRCSSAQAPSAEIYLFASFCRPARLPPLQHASYLYPACRRRAAGGRSQQGTSCAHGGGKRSRPSRASGAT